MATIAEIATTNEDLDILVAALGFIDDETGSDLVATVANPDSDLTVFAPTDAAFAATAPDLGFTGDTSDEGAVTAFYVSLGATLLNEVVTYHISAGAQDAATISSAGTVTTLNGTITAELPRLIDNEPDLLDPAVTTPNIAADNGIVHLIDRVLLPIDLPDNDAGTITDIVAASGELDTNGADFDILLNAVLAADLAGALADEDAEFTVFAPDDAAFTAFATLLGYGGAPDAEEHVLRYIVEALTLLSNGDDFVPLLTDVLLFHVSPDDLTSEQVLATDTYPTLLGVDLTRDGTFLETGDPDLPNPQLQTLDIQAANGIIHVIDNVLLPVDVLQDSGPGTVEFLIRGAGDNTIDLGAGNDYADGNRGDDSILGGSGADVVLGGGGEDTVKGGRGNDVVRGGHGDDEVRGAGGADRVIGGEGDDLTVGGAGADTIRGGQGDDTMTGGKGADLFVFLKNSGTDTVTDFDAGIDTLGLKNAGFASKAAALAAFSQDGDDAVLALVNGGTVILEDVDVDSLSRSDLIV